MISHQEAGGVRRLRAEVFGSLILSTIQKKEDRVEKRFIDYIVKAKDLYGKETRVHSVLKDMALGKKGRIILIEAEALITLPFVTRVSIETILRFMEEVAAELDKMA